MEFTQHEMAAPVGLHATPLSPSRMGLGVPTLPPSSAGPVQMHGSAMYQAKEFAGLRQQQQDMFARKASVHAAGLPMQASFQQQQQASLSEALRDEVQRRITAENEVDDLKRRLASFTTRDNRAEGQSQRLANQLRQQTLQHEEELQMERRSAQLQELRAQQYCQQLLEDVESRARGELCAAQGASLDATAHLASTLHSERHSTSLAAARSSEEAARQGVVIVDLETQVQQLTTALAAAEQAAVDSVRDFLQTVKQEAHETQQQLLARIEDGTDDLKRAEEREVYLERTVDDMRVEIQMLRKDLAAMTKRAERADTLDAKLKSVEAAHQDDKVKAQRERSDLTRTHQKEVSSLLSEKAAEVRHLRSECDLSSERSRELESKVLGLEGNAHKLRSAIQDTAQSMSSSLSAKLEGDEKARSQGSNNALHEAIQHTQNTLDQMKLRFSTQIESLSSQLSKRNSEVEHLRSVIDSADTVKKPHQDDTTTASRRTPSYASTAPSNPPAPPNSRPDPDTCNDSDSSHSSASDLGSEVV